MLYRVLGDLAIEHKGQSLILPGGNLQLVMATLLIKANQQVYSSELVRVAWDGAEAPPNQLAKRIHQIRNELDRVGHKGRLISYRGRGYELRVHDGELDALRFRRLVIQAGEAARSGDTAMEVVHLREALALWMGHHVASNLDSAAIRELGLGLEEQRKIAAVRLVELELAQGNLQEALTLLVVLRDYYLTDRRLCQLLMYTQYRRGDYDSAEATYHRYKRAALEVTAMPPEVDIVSLRYAIASHDEAKVIDLAEGFLPRPDTALALTTIKPRQLPVGPDVFVGRAEPADEAAWLLRMSASRAGGTNTRRIAAPIVVIFGPSGIGKSALALYTAHSMMDEFPDGQLFAQLHRTSNGRVPSEEVLTDFLRALGVARPPSSGADRVVLYRNLVADRRILIVLDDAYDEEQIRDLIPTGKQCAVIVTSRRQLPDLYGAHHVPRLGPLAPEMTFELFSRLVARTDGVRPTTSPDLERLLALCSGLPLAVRTVAMLYLSDDRRSVRDLADQLASDGSSLLMAGQLSLDRSIGAGVDRLSRDARRLFLGLGLTALSEFELWTAAAILDDCDADPARALSSLVNYNLIDPVEPGQRYRFHDLTRNHARSRAQHELGDESAQRGLLSRTYGALLTLARRGHRLINGGDFEIVHSSTPAWSVPTAVASFVDAMPPLNWFERERHNIRAAVEHCADLELADLAWDLALTAQEFYGIKRHFGDWYATHAIALAACRSAGDTRGEAALLASLGQPTLVASRTTAGISRIEDLQRAIDLMTDAGDPHGLAIAQRTLANALRRRGQLARPLALFTSALAGYEAADDLLGQVQTRRFIGQTYLDKGEVDNALAALGQAYDLGQRLNDTYALAQTSYWLGEAHLAGDDPTAATTAFSTLLEVFGGDSSGAGAAYSAHAQGDLALALGDHETAHEHLARAARLAQAASDMTLGGRVQLSLAKLYRTTHRQIDEVAALNRAVKSFADGELVYLQAVALTALAEVGAGEADDVTDRLDTLYHITDLPVEDRVHRLGEGKR